MWGLRAQGEEIEPQSHLGRVRSIKGQEEGGRVEGRLGTASTAEGDLWSVGSSRRPRGERDEEGEWRHGWDERERVERGAAYRMLMHRAEEDPVGWVGVAQPGVATEPRGNEAGLVGRLVRPQHPREHLGGELGLAGVGGDFVELGERPLM